MNISYFVFLTLGINRKYMPTKQQGDSTPTKTTITEPHGSMICRRNILALASILVLTGSAGIDPHDLSVFGVEFPGGRANCILAAAAIAAHLYWYIMRFFYLKDGGAIVPSKTYAHEHLRPKGLSVSHVLVRNTADVIANRVAVALTLSSWAFIANWLDWV